MGGADASPARRYAGLRALAALVHAIPEAVGEMSWADGGPPVTVGRAAGRDMCPCHLRAAVSDVHWTGSTARLSGQFGRRGEPEARVVGTDAFQDLGAGVYRFGLPGRVFAVFATTLDPVAAQVAALGAATLPAPLRAGGMSSRPSLSLGGLDVGVLGDELMGVSLVWVCHSHDAPETTAVLLLDTAPALAGACASAEAELDR